MEDDRSVIKLFSSPANSKTNTLPSGTNSYWYYNQEESLTKIQALKRGWLERQASKLFGSRKQKWVVLVDDTMFCYEDENEFRSATNVISLTNKMVTEVASGDGGGGNSQKYSFQISPVELNSDGKTQTSSKNVDVFVAATEQDRKDWVKCLKRAIYGPVGGGIFGGSLDDTLSFERRRSRGRLVPEIVEECVRFIGEHGIDVDGIFRLTGKKSLVRKLQERYDRGERPTLVLLSSYDDSPPRSLSSPSPRPAERVDVHSAASLLKSYLLELPQPIVPVDFYVDVMTVVTREYELDPDSSVEKISNFVCQLPGNSYNLLRYLCEFLKRVGDSEGQNRMSYQNLAKVFCNAILEPEDNDPALLMGTADNRAKAVTIMITFVGRIFKDDWKFEEGRSSKRGSRTSRFWDDAGEKSVFTSGPKLENESTRETLEVHTKMSAKSLEMLSDGRAGKKSNEGLASDNKKIGNSFSNLFSKINRFGSARKSGDAGRNPEKPSDVPDRLCVTEDSSDRDAILRIRSTENSRMRRSSSVKNHATKDKLSLLDELYDSPGLLLHSNRSTQSISDQASDRNSGTSEDLELLMCVDPKSLTTEELVEKFSSLQRHISAERQRLEDTKREHSKEVSRLEREVEDQARSTEQAVARVVDLQSQLEKYFLKYGSL